MNKVDIKEAYKKLNTAEKMAISTLHNILDDIKQNPERYTDPVQLIEDIEHTLQGLWRFQRDANFHTHWIDIKGCTCPRTDNMDRIGYGRVTDNDCPWHGGNNDPHS